MSKFTETAVLDRALNRSPISSPPRWQEGLPTCGADPQLQARLDELASKANQGQLILAERQEYQDYVDAIDFIGIFQAKARAVLARTTSA